MNRNTVFKFEFVSDLDCDELGKKNDEIDSNFLSVNYLNNHLNGHSNGHLNSHLNGHLNAKLNGHLNGELNGELNYELNQKLNNQFNQNLNYQLNRQFNEKLNHQYDPQQFSRQLNQRLTQHLNSLNKQQSTDKLIYRTVNRTNLKQNKLINSFLNFLTYYKASLNKLNLKLIYLTNFLIFYLQFIVIDFFHFFIFKFLFTNNYRKKVLINWINKVLNNDLSKCQVNGNLNSESNRLNFDDQSNNKLKNKSDNDRTNFLSVHNFTELFADGKLLCKLVNYLNRNACSRYDLLDANDVDTNQELAYRLILTYYGLDEKINLVNSNETELKLIDLISKIRYYEMKKLLCSRYKIDNDQIKRNFNKNLVGFFRFSYFFSV